MEGEQQQQHDGEGLARCSWEGLPSTEITATEQANRFLLHSFKQSEVLQKFTGKGDEDGAAGDEGEWDSPQDEDNDEPAEGAEVIRAEVETLSIEDASVQEAAQ